MGETAKRLITVVLGPARSGKTSRVVDLFLGARAAGRRALVVVPDSAAASAMRWRLLAHLPALPGGCVSTFVALSHEILALGGSPPALISPHEGELLLRGIVAELAASGRLRAFAGAVEYDGFYAQLASFIRELKSCQVEPDAFRKSQFGRKSQRDRELAEIYGRYQRSLDKARLYDAQGRLWAARVVLERLPAGRRIYDDVFLDGFTDFTASELSLLRAFSNRTGGILVTLPYDSDRSDLFAKTSNTLGSLKRDFQLKKDELSAPDARNACSRIASLFMTGEPPPPAPSAGQVRFVSTAGVRMEAEEIAREAKRIILAGRSPSDVAVVARAPSIYRDALKEAFERLGVPLDAASPMEFSKSRLCALLGALVALAERDFQRETVTSVMSSPYVELPALASGELSGADVVRMARDAGIVKGFRQWQARLECLENSFKEERPSESPEDENERVTTAPEDLPRVAALQNALKRLSELVWPFQRPAPAGVLAAHLETVIEALGTRRRILGAGLPEEVLFADLASFAALKGAVGAIARSGHAGAALSARSFLRLVARAADAEASSGGISGGGVVFLDVVTARNLSFPVVFLCGVLADSFPSALPVGPFHDRREREQLAQLGLTTRSEKAHLASERLLFYQAATRAEEALYITYPSTDEAGKPKLASFYLDDLKALFTFDEGDVRAFGPSRVVKPLEEASSPDEVAVSVGRLVSEAKLAEEIPPVAALACKARPGFESALRSAAVEAERESFDRFDCFDAVLTVGPAASVARRFPPKRPWSGTSLTGYRMCPFLFFLDQVLRAERVEEPDVVPTPIARGLMAHEFLARFFGRLHKERLLEAVLQGDEKVRNDFFEEAFRSISGSHQKALGLAGDPFWEIEKARMRAVLLRFVAHEIGRLSAESGFVPAFFELSFGESRHRGLAKADAASVARTVAVESEGRAETLCGRIDRVDYCRQAPAAGASVRTVAIVDYKLSRKVSAQDVESFADMQIAAYLFAVPHVVSDSARVLPVEAFCRTIKDLQGSRPVKAFREEGQYAAWRSAFARVLVDTAERIREGFFAPMPGGDCPRYCAGRGVCRFSQTRNEALREKDAEA